MIAKEAVFNVILKSILSTICKQLFCTYNLGLHFFVAIVSVEKLLKKCWWNWHLITLVSFRGKNYNEKRQVMWLAVKEWTVSRNLEKIKTLLIGIVFLPNVFSIQLQKLHCFLSNNSLGEIIKISSYIAFFILSCDDIA
jgi:hypothetical protein